MTNKKRKESTEKITSKETTKKTTGKIQALDDEALKDIVGGNGTLEGTFNISDEPPDWTSTSGS